MLHKFFAFNNHVVVYRFSKLFYPLGERGGGAKFGSEGGLTNQRP